MSEHATETTSAVEPGGHEQAGAAEQPFAIPESEWETFRDNVDVMAGFIGAQQAAGYEAQQAAERERLADLAWEDPHAYAQAVADRAVAPFKAQFEEFQAAQAADAAEDLAEDILVEAGVSDEQLDDVRAAAEPIYEETLVETAHRLGADPQYAIPFEQLQRTDPDAAAEWVAKTQRDIAVWALQKAAHDARLPEKQAEREAFYRGGGTASDVFFARPANPEPTTGDHTQGGRLSDRFFR